MAKTAFPNPRFIAGTTRHHRLSAFALCIALRQDDPLAVRTVCVFDRHRCVRTATQVGGRSVLGLAVGEAGETEHAAVA